MCGFFKVETENCSLIACDIQVLIINKNYELNWKHAQDLQSLIILVIWIILQYVLINNSF